MKKYKWSEPLCKSVLMDLCRRGVQNKRRTINRTLREKNLPVKTGRPARERQGIEISSLTLPLAAENCHPPHLLASPPPHPTSLPPHPPHPLPLLNGAISLRRDTTITITASSVWVGNRMHQLHRTKEW